VVLLLTKTEKKGTDEVEGQNTSRFLPFTEVLTEEKIKKVTDKVFGVLKGVVTGTWDKIGLLGNLGGGKSLNELNLPIFPVGTRA